MKKHIRLLSFFLALLLGVSCLLTACTNSSIKPGTSQSTPDDTSSSGKDDGKDPQIDFSTLSLIAIMFNYQSINKDNIDYNEAMEAAINAFIAATGDKYAKYYTEKELQEEIVSDNGSLYGIGVTVIFDSEDYSLEIVFVTPDSPAEKAGLKAGMKITHIGTGKDRKSTESIVEEYVDKYLEEYIKEYKKEYPDEKDENVIETAAKNAVEYVAYKYIVSQIKGKEGTKAEFSVTDESGIVSDYSVERSKVTNISVKGRISETDSTVGIVSVSEFDLLTPKQFCDTMDDLISKGAKKFVFDMRNNPGGDLESVVAVISFFLNKNDLIVTTKNVNQQEEKRYAVEKKHGKPDDDISPDYSLCDVSEQDIGKYRNYEKVVLINGNTASAAELFTSALRDYSLALTVGTKSYGKGSVQSRIDLSRFGEQYSGALKLTTKLYFPPSGEGYDGIGIEPDKTAELSEEAKKLNFYKLTEQNDDQLKTAIEILISK